MPLYEYVCKKCGERFELLVSAGTEIRCAACGSASVEKQFSTFSAQSDSSSSCGMGSPCCDDGSCPTGKCPYGK